MNLILTVWSSHPKKPSICWAFSARFAADVRVSGGFHHFSSFHHSG